MSSCVLFSLSTFCSPVFLCSSPPWHLSQISFVSTALFPVSLHLHLIPSLVQFALKLELFSQALLLHLFPGPPALPLFLIWSSFLWIVPSLVYFSLSGFFFFFFFYLWPCFVTCFLDLVFPDFIRSSSLISSSRLVLCLHLGPRRYAIVTQTEEKPHSIDERFQVTSMISDILVNQKYDLAPNAAVSSDQW